MTDPRSNEALPRYENFVKADPRNPLLWISLGDLYHQCGRTDEAQACFEKALIHAPHNDVAKSRLAATLITQHRFAEAERWLAVLAYGAADPDPVILHNLGLTQFYQRRFQEASDTFQAAETAGLTAPDNAKYLTYALHHLGDTGAALHHAERWLAAEPGPANRGYVALLHMDHGDMDKAYQHAAQVLEEQPDSTDAAVVMGTWLVEQQEIDKAIVHFQHITEREPENPRGWLGLGLICMYNQQHGDAVRHIERALTFMPDNTGTLVVLGWANLMRQNLTAAEKVFRHAIALDHNFGEAHGGLAVALVLQNRIDAAQSEIKIATRLDPQGFGAVYARSIALKCQGKGEQATRMLSKLLQRSPGADNKPLIEHIQTFVRRQTPSTPPRAGSVLKN